MTRGDLKAILEAGDVDACLAYFERATEEERAAVASQALEWYKAQKANWMIADSPNSWRTNPLIGAASTAVIAACSLSQIKKEGITLGRADTDARVMEARRPAWLTDYAAWSLERLPAIWPAVRRLERAGLCRRPDTDSYTLGMIEGIAWRGGKSDVREALLSDPELLDREVWRLFEVEGNGEFSLAARDKYSRAEATWEAGLIALSAEGKLPRTQLLDASLDALERDFAQFRAGWFSRFHESLEPTIDERAERWERYLSLVSSKIPPTVSFALGALSKLDRADRLPSATLIERIGPAFTARAKGSASAALKLLESALKRVPDLRKNAVKTAISALLHESADVQGAAFEFVRRHGERSDSSLVSDLRERVDHLAASVRPLLLEWLRDPEAATSSEFSSSNTSNHKLEKLLVDASRIPARFRSLAGIDAIVDSIHAGRFEVEALRFDGTEIPRLYPDARITPINDVDELIDAFSAVLENPERTDDLERALDGVSRLCGQRPATFETHTRPLRKRAIALLERTGQSGPFRGGQIALDLYALALAWIDGVVLDPDSARPCEQQRGRFVDRWLEYDVKVGKWSGKVSVRAVERNAEMLSLSRRVLEVARRAALGCAHPLLSAPTHRGGWIDPITLVDRIEACRGKGVVFDIHDQVLALLRLAPDHREEASARLKPAGDEFTQATYHALGSQQPPIGPTAALWVAAARARAPFDDDPRVIARHPDLGPDAGNVAHVGFKPKTARNTVELFNLERTPRAPSNVPPELVTVRLHLPGSERDAASIRWGGSLWPIGREAWLAQGVEAIGSNLDWWCARWGNRTYLEALTDPDLPLRTMGLLLLTVGLAAKQPDEAGLATDGLIAAIEDGRVDGRLLGGSMGLLLSTGLVKAARWAKTLGVAARVSPLHARVVARTIQHTLSEELKNTPRDLLALLELLKETLVELGEPVSVGDARNWLTAFKGSGKTSSIARELLKLTDCERMDIRRGVAIQALERRVERAERWSRAESSVLSRKAVS
jgi:hypothetical protein